MYGRATSGLRYRDRFGGRHMDHEVAGHRHIVATDRRFHASTRLTVPRRPARRCHRVFPRRGEFRTRADATTYRGCLSSQDSKGRCCEGCVKSRTEIADRRTPRCGRHGWMSRRRDGQVIERERERKSERDEAGITRVRLDSLKHYGGRTWSELY